MHPLEAYKQQIDEALSLCIPLPASPRAPLYAGARYALLGEGKRLRPLLTLLVAACFCPRARFPMGLPPVFLNKALTVGCAIEMVHTYSLIHDDLPCMDNDDFRRGRPTLHRVYTEAHALLIGNYLLTAAFEKLAHTPDLNLEQKVDALAILAQAAGGEGMVGGQVMDIERLPKSEEIFQLLPLYKTAALFQAAAELGALVVEGSDTERETARSLGREFGLFYQFVDDCLDKDHPSGPLWTKKAALRHYEQLCALLEPLSSGQETIKELADRALELLKVPSLHT